MVNTIPLFFCQRKIIVEIILAWLDCDGIIRHLPRWWNGIHDGLKIRWRKPYEFESRLEDFGLVAQWKSSALLRHWSWVQIPPNPFTWLCPCPSEPIPFLWSQEGDLFFTIILKAWLLPCLKNLCKNFKSCKELSRMI